MRLEEQKATARKTAFARRKAAHDLRLPGTAGRLSEVLAGYRGVCLAGFIPIRTEIDPLPAMAEASAHGPVAVPVIRSTGEALVFSRWEPGCAMVDGPFGAAIPKTERLITPEVLIVPLVAFTREGDRLGYGGGFYDRTLEQLRSRHPTLAIGFAYAAQEAKVLPMEPTDQRLNMIVTEREVIEIAR